MARELTARERDLLAALTTLLQIDEDEEESATPTPAPPAAAGDADGLAAIREAILGDFPPDSRGKALDPKIALRDQTYYSANRDALLRFQHRVDEAQREIELQRQREDSIAQTNKRHEKRRAEEAAERKAREAADLEATREFRKRLPAFRQE